MNEKNSVGEFDLDDQSDCLDSSVQVILMVKVITVM